MPNPHCWPVMEPTSLTPDPADAVVADHCHLRIPSLPEWIEPTVDYLIRRGSLCGGLHPKRATKVTVALVEAVTNAIVHGNLGISSQLKEQGDQAFADAVTARCADPNYATRVVDLRATYDGQYMRWTVTDQGAGFDVEAALARLDDPEPDLTKPSGRGIMLIRAFMDEFRYEDRGRRLVLTLKGNHGNENRVADRLPFAQGVEVTPVDAAGRADWSQTHPALARNISEGGVALLQSHLATRGRVIITIPTGGEPIQVPAEVRHWHALSENVLEVGCRFEAGPPTADLPPPNEALAALVGRLSEEFQPLAERRVAIRVPYTECVGIDLEDGTSARGFGRDLSRGGIAFFTATRLPVGVIHVTLPQGANEEPLRVRAAVVRCTPLTEGFYDIAARFVGG
jgi:anti-sigma regulatory factor (Ser/Thr protein kinase)